MKKLLVVALAFTAMAASAQDSKFVVKAGVGMSSVVGSDADTKMTVAFKAGFAYEWGVSENFYLIPGLEFVGKGFKSEIVDGRIGMAYLQVPVLASYKFKVSDGVKLALKAGPYVGFGVLGSDIEFYDYSKINVFDSDGGYRRFDAGVMGGLSLDFDSFSVGVEYSRGLVSLDSDVSQYNQAFGLTFGYRF